MEMVQSIPTRARGLSMRTHLTAVELALECTKLIKVGIFWKLDTLDSYPVHFGVIEGLVISLYQTSNSLGMFINRYCPMGGGGWGEGVILVRHNLSIIPPAEHNFEHNTMVSWVTPESIVFYLL